MMSSMTSPELTGLKSSPPIENSFIRFINLCRHEVDILWVNYEGSRVKFSTVTHRKYFDVNTFVGHPWIFINSRTGDPMVIMENSHKKYSHVFWPKGYGENETKKRRVVFIMLPVYSLTECCFQAMRRYGVTQDSVSQLYIPRTIQDDFKHYLTKTEKERILQIRPS